MDVSIFAFKNGCIVETDVCSSLTENLIGKYLSLPFFQVRRKLFKDSFPLPSGFSSTLSHRKYKQLWDEYLKLTEAVRWLIWQFGYESPSFEEFNLYLLMRYDSYIEHDYSENPVTMIEDIVIDFSNRDDMYSEEEYQPDYLPGWNLGLIIRRRMTINELHEWIDKNKNKIDLAISSLPFNVDKSINFTELRLTHEMNELYLAGKTPSQISSILCEKYSDHPYLSDEGWVANKLLRFRKLQSNYSESDSVTNLEIDYLIFLSESHLLPD